MYGCLAFIIVTAVIGGLFKFLCLIFPEDFAAIATFGILIIVVVWGFHEQNLKGERDKADNQERFDDVMRRYRTGSRGLFQSWFDNQTRWRFADQITIADAATNVIELYTIPVLAMLYSEGFKGLLFDDIATVVGNERADRVDQVIRGSILNPQQQQGFSKLQEIAIVYAFYRLFKR